MATPKEKTIPWAGRLPETAYKLLHKRAGEAGISSRAWLTEVLLADKVKIVAKQKPHPDLSGLVFQVNKAGNNLNQIAKRINELMKTGQIDFAHAKIYLDNLLAIEAELKKAVEHAS